MWKRTGGCEGVGTVVLSNCTIIFERMQRFTKKKAFQKTILSHFGYIFTVPLCTIFITITKRHTFTYI